MAVVSLLVLLTIIQLVRRKRLDEKYAFLWVMAGAFMLLAFFALCLINLQFSVVLSRLSKHNKQLAQRVALLEQRVKQAAPSVPDMPS